jgi:hypothetical protein
MILIDWYREWRDLFRCESCDTLREQLAIANEEKRQLLQTLQSYHKKPEATIPTQELPQTIQRGPIPWKIKRELMEGEDREKARIMSTIDKTNEELEKMLGVIAEEPDASKVT